MKRIVYYDNTNGKVLGVESMAPEIVRFLGALPNADEALSAWASKKGHPFVLADTLPYQADQSDWVVIDGAVAVKATETPQAQPGEG